MKRERAVARDWKPAFLEALRNCGNVRKACEAAGIDRTTSFAARKASPRFRKEWEEAIEDACDLLEAAAWERATSVTAPSDGMIQFLLKCNRPLKYRETLNVNVSWRLRIQEAGYDPDELFTSLVAAVREREIAAHGGSSDGVESNGDGDAGEATGE